jgi:hypothetical protein
LAQTAFAADRIEHQTFGFQPAVALTGHYGRPLDVHEA